MDLYTAGVSETPVAGGQVGPTFACLIGQQFKSLKTGDRFYYENSGSTAFTADQLDEIRKMTLAKVICRNTGISQMQRQALKDVQSGNPLVNCNNIPDLDLTPWGQGGCTPVHGGWSAWQQTPCFGMWRLKYRTCTNPTPNECGRPCPGGAPFEIQIEFCGRSSWPFGGIRNRDVMLRPGPIGMEPGMVDPMPNLVENAAILDQVKSQLSGLTAGQALDASVFERAIAAVSPSGPAELSPNLTPNFRRTIDAMPIDRFDAMRAMQ